MRFGANAGDVESSASLNFPWCLSGPAPAGGAEGALAGVAEQERDLGQRQVRLVQIPEGQLMPQAVDNIRKAHVEIAKPSGKGALAQAQIGRHDLVACPAGGEQLDDAALQLLQEFGLCRFFRLSTSSQ